jgi:secernin
VSSVPPGVVGLTGTDLVRLALERGTRAEHAVDVIVELLQRHGQAQAEHLAGESRHASFLVADPDQAFALETAGSCWAVDQVRTVRALSGGLSITGFADRHGHWLRATLGGAAARQARALSLGERAGSAADLARALRDHGPDRPWPSYGWLGGGASSICAHAAGLGIGLQTTGSWLAELGTARPRHWVTATAAPCTGLFKPVSVDCPIELGPAAAPWADEHSLWWRHERFHRKLMRDPKRLAQCFVAERDAIEATWLAAPPESGEAFARADGLLRRWTERVTAVTIRDGRPMAARRAWRARDRDARLV